MNEDSSRESFWVRCGLSSGGSRRSELRLAGMTLVWAVLFAGAKQLLTNDLVKEGPLGFVTLVGDGRDPVGTGVRPCEYNTSDT